MELPTNKLPVFKKTKKVYSPPKKPTYHYKLEKFLSGFNFFGWKVGKSKPGFFPKLRVVSSEFFFVHSKFSLLPFPFCFVLEKKWAPDNIWAARFHFLGRKRRSDHYFAIKSQRERRKQEQTFLKDLWRWFERNVDISISPFWTEHQSCFTLAKTTVAIQRPDAFTTGKKEKENGNNWCFRRQKRENFGHQI